MKTVVKMLAEYDGKYLLVRRSKTAPRRPLKWDFPGGISDSDNYQKEVLRELKEETGLEQANCSLVYEFIDSFNGEAIRFMFFYCRLNSRKVTLSYEHDKSMWVKFDEIIKYNDYPVHQKALGYLKGVPFPEQPKIASK